MKAQLLFLCSYFVLSIGLAQAQNGSVERIKVYSKALEGNLINDPAEREVSIYLPPSYANETSKRYPVVYMLHGFTSIDTQWFGPEDGVNLPQRMKEGIAAGITKEMILVMPNAYNRFKGSMYSTSITIGDWETFITKELVDHIDANYRTLPNRDSRGLAGHSMGGYGTMRLGMKYPDVYSSIYVLSACCMEGQVSTNPDFMKNIEAITSIDQLEDASFGVMANLASAASWAPNPNNPPFYLDLPFADGKVRPDIASKFAANRTLSLCH